MSDRPRSAYVRTPAHLRTEGEWRMYRFWGRLPREAGLGAFLSAWLLGDWQRLLYVGQTGRHPLVRATEHSLDKRWAKDILVVEIDPRIWRSEQAMLKAEAAAIRRERPVWNVAHNGNNPGAAKIRRRLARRVAVRRRRHAGWLIGLTLLGVAAAFLTRM